MRRWRTPAKPVFKYRAQIGDHSRVLKIGIGLGLGQPLYFSELLNGMTWPVVIHARRVRGTQPHTVVVMGALLRRHLRVTAGALG